MRSKPSKLGGTTGTEDVSRLATQHRGQDTHRVSSLDRTHDAGVGGGAIFGKPHERKFDVACQRTGPWTRTVGRVIENRTIRTESLKTRRRIEGRVPDDFLSGVALFTATLEGQAYSVQGHGGRQGMPRHLSLGTVNIRNAMLSSTARKMAPLKSPLTT